jgi:FkbM family methyltransferase
MDCFFETPFSDFYKDFPLVLIDVGASGGLEKNWFEAKRHLQIIGFEPDERAYNELIEKQNNITKYFNIALGDGRDTPFYLTKKQQTSSIYKPNYKFLKSFPEIERFDLIGEIELKTDTLDNLYNKGSLNRADFIKLDTQGSELSILNCGKKILSNLIFGCEVEVEFVEMYENQPLFSAVDQFMEKQGYYLFDIQRVYWKRKSENIVYGKKGQLVFGNALYLKKPDYFKKTVENLNDLDLKKSKVLNAISICLLYGYVDYAHEIFNDNKAHFNNIESKLIANQLKKIKFVGNYIPAFKGKGRLSNLFYTLGDILNPNNSFWSKIDKLLGNR